MTRLKLLYWKLHNRALKRWPFRKKYQAKIAARRNGIVERAAQPNILGSDESSLDSWEMASQRMWWDESKRTWVPIEE